MHSLQVFAQRLIGPAMKKLLLVHTGIIAHVIPWENGHWLLNTDFLQLEKEG